MTQEDVTVTLDELRALEAKAVNANRAFIVAAVQYVRDALSVEGREAYNDRAGSSSESNSITDPARPVARPNSGGSVDSRRV